MGSSFDFDEMFGGFEGEFMKRMRREMREIEEAVKSGRLEGKWDIKQIDEPGVKGYIIQGRFWSDQPSGDLDPFEPFRPLRRRPMPERSFNVPERALREVREPLIDVLEEEKAMKVYVELPGEEKEDIQVNVMEGRVEVKAKNFYKMIDLPTRNGDVERASSNYKNGVLEVTIPKKDEASEGEKRKIKIE